MSVVILEIFNLAYSLNTFSNVNVVTLKKKCFLSVKSLNADVHGRSFLTTFILSGLIVKCVLGQVHPAKS